MSKLREKTLIPDIETKQLLDERLEAHRKNPNEGSIWKVVKSRIMEHLVRY